ncbi:uncharacterized protein LOC105383468 [Plutella xylostella]|uniref:uncharacterized protein LOC105383468 n=1 Tax=Plutella xylostella TaxID=51655 RepID=UPI0020323C5A|nr:uncharacterized protein LOC105383468 [Plutella xylostella]
METDEPKNPGLIHTLDDPDSRSAVNSLILDYYKKFGRKRDLEQYFSLSTVSQSDIRDPTSLFWRRMKAQTDSSDSCEKPSESSTELCRISIQCSVPVESSSQDEKSDQKCKAESVSPPIIIEEVSPRDTTHSDNESVKSEGNHSHKSVDITLDTSMNKPVSPTSSITSQRKLEWDSLADVGYANETDRKTSGSSLSTLERLALLQQYSNSDNKENVLGQPTAHSTLIEPTHRSKTNKKSLIKKTKEVHSKGVDIVELNVPQSSKTHPISVNLTRHISFNVENDGGISIGNIDKEVKVTSPDKQPLEKDVTPEVKIDKEIQTSLPKPNTGTEKRKECIPVLLSLNSLKSRLKRRKPRTVRKKSSKKVSRKKKPPLVHEKSGEQVSEAESFEYMPGHIYNQNQMMDDHHKTRNSAGNKSSLESSGGVTTESSKTNASLTKDLEKNIQLLENVLKQYNNDSKIKKKLIKELVIKLLNSKYKGDGSTTDFLSGLSLSSKCLNLAEGNSKNATTTSTSDTNNTGEKTKRPKKSILRMDKFNSSAIASTSQSVPNLPTVGNSENPMLTKYKKQQSISHTESDISSKCKDSTDTVFAKTSSEELYQKYIEALKREEAYKKHLRDKENFMRQKLTGSDGGLKAPLQTVSDAKQNRLKELINDLATNNYADGSGDARKLEGYPNKKDIEKYIDMKKQRSHSVFTLSSGNSQKKEKENRKIDLRKRLQNEIEAGSSGTSKAHYCCCPHHNKCTHVVDTTRQANTSGQGSCSGNETQIKTIAQVHNVDQKESEEVCKNKSSKSSSPRGDKIEIKPGQTNICIKSSSSSHICDHPGSSCESGKKFYKTGQFKVEDNNSSKKSPRATSSECDDSCSSRKKPYDSQKKKSDCVDMPKQVTPSHIIADKITGEIKYVYCLCTGESVVPNENLLVYKCSRLMDKGVQLGATRSGMSNDVSVQCSGPSSKGSTPRNDNIPSTSKETNEAISRHLPEKVTDIKRSSQSSQTNLPCHFSRRFSERSVDTGTSRALERRRNSSPKRNVAYNCFKNQEPDRKILILEITRCIQTGISIDPNISNPSLSDINIVSDCAEVVSKQYREVSLKSAENSSIKSKIAEMQLTHPKDMFVGTPQHTERITNVPGFVENDCNINVESNIDIYEKRYEKTSQEVNMDSYKIPLQGTNMTLMVSVESKNTRLPFDDVKKGPTLATKGIATEVVENLNKYTSLREECSKGVQSEYTNIFEQVHSSTKSGDVIISAEKPKVVGQNDKIELNTKDVACDCNINERNQIEKPTKTYETNDDDKNEHVFAKPREKSGSYPCNKRSLFIKRNTDPTLIDKAINVDANDSDSRAVATRDLKDSEKQTEILSNAQDERSNYGSGTYPATNKKIILRTNTNPYLSSGEQENMDIEAQIKSESYQANYKDRASNYVEIQTKDFGTSCNTGDVSISRSPNNNPKSATYPTANKKIFTKRNTDPAILDDPNNQDNLKSMTQRIDVTEKFKPTSSITSRSQSETDQQTTDYDSSDPVLQVIKDITRRYSKSDIGKGKDKKCYKEIMTLLKCLLDTEDATDTRSSSDATPRERNQKRSPLKEHKKTVDVGTSSPVKRRDKKSDKKHKSSNKTSGSTESTDFPGTTERESSDAAACHVLNKIKKECEKYHQNRCKPCHHHKESSSTSVNCEACKKMHHCACRNRCKGSRVKAFEKIKKKCVAYNLILQTSDSMIPEEEPCNVHKHPLQNVVVKVPPKRPNFGDNVQFKVTDESPRSRFVPNTDYHRPGRIPNESEISSTDDYKRELQALTVRDYLERNRPDFIENTSDRQNALRVISETRSRERDATRRLLSLQLQRAPLSAVSATHVTQLARELGIELRRRKLAPKFISEREMKKHSEKIYKSLPEVVQKKEDLRKENIKKTNLLMASMFKKSLQKKTLRGSVNISNYSAVIKI